MYYSYDKLLSRNALLNFVIGERGVGKTLNAKKFAINDFINNSHQFIYIRRFKTELDTAMSTFFKDLQANGYFEDLALTVKKKKEYYVMELNGEEIGYGIALTTSAILKSTAFPDVKNVIFDEFLINQGSAYHFLKDEVTQFLECIETIGRLRDLRIFLLGNSTTITNPYFAYFGINSLPYNSEFKTYKNGLICVNYIRNYEYRQAKRKSKFGQLIDGTDYGDYAIDNKFLYDDNSFIQKKPAWCKFWCIITIDGFDIGLWRDFKNGFIFLSKDLDPNTPLRFACSVKDHKTNTIFIQYKRNPYVKLIVESFCDGGLFFESQTIKNISMKLINKCIAR